MVYLFLYIVNEPLFFFDVDFNKKKCVKKVINEKHWKKPLSAMKALHQNYRKHTNRSRCIPEANPETFATCIIDTHAHVPRHKITLIRWQGSAFNCKRQADGDSINDHDFFQECWACARLLPTNCWPLLNMPGCFQTA